MTESKPDSEIDFDHLNQYVAGDVALTREVFGLFQHQVEMWGRALDPNVDDDTWESVTHTLKGSARAVGAMQLAEECQFAETLIGAENRPGRRAYAAQNIEFRISRTIAEIQRWEYRQTMLDLKNT